MNATRFEIENQGVRIHGERSGAGDSVLMIHGAGVDRSFFAAAARELSGRFEVIAYDRRGYTESVLPDDSAASECSVAVQAEDAAAIIRALGGGAPMHVVAHSGGCTIAMELACLHPELVRRVILDEPFIIDCLPVGSSYEDVVKRIIDEMSRGNEIVAISLLGDLIGGSDPRSRAEHTTPPEVFRANNSHFIRNEFPVFSSYTPDYQALRSIDLCIFSSEIDHGEEYPQCACELGSRLDAPVYIVPGKHNFPTDFPEEFARFVAGTLLL